MYWYRVYKNNRKFGFIWADTAKEAHRQAKKHYPNDFIEVLRTYEAPTLKRQVIPNI